MQNVKSGANINWDLGKGWRQSFQSCVRVLIQDSDGLRNLAPLDTLTQQELPVLV